MIISKMWNTKQVEYTNTFYQEYLKEEVYIDPIIGLRGSDSISKVLRIIKSIYGIRQAPITFFDKLLSDLLKQGFIQSKPDPCLFMKYNIICLVYVGDAFISGTNKYSIEYEIKTLGVSSDKKRH